MNNSRTVVGVAVSLAILAAIFFVIERIAGRGRNREQPVT
jgi:hypothetical protein